MINDHLPFLFQFVPLMGLTIPLQKDHFNENYLESTKYPNATFTGKIIENVDLSVDGVYTIRAKGKLNIHGIEQERILKSRISCRREWFCLEILFYCNFGRAQYQRPENCVSKNS